MSKMSLCILFLLVVLASFSHLLAQPADSSFQYPRTPSFVLTGANSNKKSAIKKITTGKPLIAFIFLSPECPLCKNYTSVLNALQQQFNTEVMFAGIIPGTGYSAALIAGFGKKYKVSYPLLIDPQKELSNYLHASITPEIILMNDKYELVYKGAIDNRVKSLGVTKWQSTEDYFSDAVSEYLQHKAITRKNVKAIGCLINDF